jgi:hypothetical protein
MTLSRAWGWQTKAEPNVPVAGGNYDRFTRLKKAKGLICQMPE